MSAGVTDGAGTCGARTYAGEQRRAVALPLGGLGTGNVAIGGTGVLKQWQLHNQGNHLGFLPQSFFALRLSCTEPPLSVRRVLRAPPVAPHPEPAPLVNDHLDAAGSYAAPVSWPAVRDTRFTGAYPFARIEYLDDWPAEVALEAYTPFVPLDADASGLPLASFTFRITNTVRQRPARLAARHPAKRRRLGRRDADQGRRLRGTRRQRQPPAADGRRNGAGAAERLARRRPPRGTARWRCGPRGPRRCCRSSTTPTPRWRS